MQATRDRTDPAFGQDVERQVFNYDVEGASHPIDNPTPCSCSDRTVNDADPAVKESAVIDEDGFRYTRDGPHIWVDFTPLSPKDPMHFPRRRKWMISAIAVLFTLWTSTNASSYAIGESSMGRDLKASSFVVAMGFTLYPWAFGLAPMLLAPFSEEFGRRPLYLVSITLFFLFYFPIAKANHIALVLVFHFLQGAVGSIGATLVGGSLADIWPAAERGSKMAFFTLMAVGGTSAAPVYMAWVEANPKLEWRWIQWIQIIMMAAYMPFIIFMPETRSAVLLRKQAKKMRDSVKANPTEEEKGGQARYMARAELGKPKIGALLRVSLVRPFHILVTEPIVIFFTIWISVGWAVLYGLVQSIPYVFENTYGFSIGRVGLVYLSMTIGCLIGYTFNFVQEGLYAKNVARIGSEARLYGAMAAGVALPTGCFIYAWTTFPHVTYVAPCIGITIAMAGVFTIYLATFNYLADSYTIYASSALAAQSLVRNMIGGSFPLFSNRMYTVLNPNWASTLFGCIGTLLAVVPFVAFFYGPRIRARSKFAKMLIEQEAKLEK